MRATTENPNHPGEAAMLWGTIKEGDKSRFTSWWGTGEYQFGTVEHPLDLVERLTTPL